MVLIITVLSELLIITGFKPETILRYYLIDEEKNERRDLVIASYNLEDWTRRFEFYSSLFSGK